MTDKGLKMLNMLADRWKKNPDSYLGRLLTLLGEQMDVLEEQAVKVEEWHDIDQAEGYPLEQLAANINQKRGSATDEILRLLIKSKAARSLSTGTIDDIIFVIALSLDTDESNVNIKELFGDPLEPEPAAIKIADIPIDRLNRVGISATQFGRIVKRSASPGVRVAGIELTGTFSFASGTTIETSTQGFANIQLTTGGTLSGVLIPDNDPDLPL